MTLVPLHADPAAHSVHAVRVLAVPPVGPDVNDPGEHVSQRGATLLLYLLSAPHRAHSLEPLREYLPAKHCAHDDEPGAA